MHPSTFTDTQVFEAYADALKALVTALGWQIDPVRLHRDLQTMASVTRKDGYGASAGLIDELARTVEVRLTDYEGEYRAYRNPLSLTVSRRPAIIATKHRGGGRQRARDHAGSRI